MNNNEKTKAAIYFPVMTNNYTSELSLNIRMNHGWGGYGIYFALIQKLAAVPERRLSINSLNAIAFELHCTVNEIKPIIENYFDSDNEYFFSIELNKSLGYYDDKFNKASEAGKKSAALLTPEQRQAKAKKAINERWTKNSDNTNDTNTNTNTLVSDTNTLVSDTNTLLTPLVSDTNNKIKENKRKEKEIKEDKTKDENFDFSDSFDFSSDLNSNLEKFESNHTSNSNSDNHISISNSDNHNSISNSDNHNSISSDDNHNSNSSDNNHNSIPTSDNHTSINSTNDFNLIYENNYIFKSSYDSNKTWKEFDISSLSNSLIAYQVLEYSEKDNFQREIHVKDIDQAIRFKYNLVKFSLKLPQTIESELRNQFLYFLNESPNKESIKKDFNIE